MPVVLPVSCCIYLMCEQNPPTLDSPLSLSLAPSMLSLKNGGATPNFPEGHTHRMADQRDRALTHSFPVTLNRGSNDILIYFNLLSHTANLEAHVPGFKKSLSHTNSFLLIQEPLQDDKALI